MQKYLNLIQEVITTGERQDNRTGVPTLSIPGAMLRFNLQEGFPAVTTKKLAFKSVVGELCAFLRASKSASNFRALGCRVWDQNANANAAWLANPFREGPDDLGPVYGVQWREWPGFKVIPRINPKDSKEKRDRLEEIHLKILSEGWSQFGETKDQNGLIYYRAIDQLRNCLDTLVDDPTSRRILFHGWNPAVLDEVALPSCHVLYQFLPNVRTKELSMSMYVRSNDLGLGAPFNIAEGAALLELVARLTGFKAKWLTYFIGDAHIYENHVEMLTTQLQRSPYPSPRLVINPRVPEYAATGIYEPKWLELIEPSDFQLVGYQHHEAITAPMAV